MAVGGDLGSYVKETSAPLSGENYNEIDGLVFSELSYMKFEEKLEEGQNGSGGWRRESELSVPEFAREMLLSPKNTENKDVRAFLEAVAQSPRYRHCTITNLQAMRKAPRELCREEKEDILNMPFQEILPVDCETGEGRASGEGRRRVLSGYKASDVYMAAGVPEIETQWAAMTVRLNDAGGTEILAMRGTDGTVRGWIEDLELAYREDGTPSQHLSRKYLREAKGKRLILAGHSKGGNDVVSAYLMSGEDIRSRVCRIDNYDGPGLCWDFYRTPEREEAFEELRDKLHNYYPKNSVIGLLLRNHPGKEIFFDADIKGHTEISIMGEHDPFAFRIADGKFMQARQTWVSRALDVAVDKQMKALPHGERRSLVDSLIKVWIPSLIAVDPSPDNPYNECQTAAAVIRTFLEVVKLLEMDRKKAVYRLIAKLVLSFIGRTPDGLKGSMDKIGGWARQFIRFSYGKAAGLVQRIDRACASMLKALGECVAEAVDSLIVQLYRLNNGIKGLISRQEAKELQPVPVRAEKLWHNEADSGQKAGLYHKETQKEKRLMPQGVI